MTIKDAILVLIAVAQLACAALPSAGEKISIGEQEFPNPCKEMKCPLGMECTIQYTPRLFKVPIGHCTKSSPTINGDSGMCVEYTVGTNILHCKSESEWEHIGNLQCRLRNESSGGKYLSSTEVKHPCPDVQRTGEMNFLAASFNCCSRDYTTTGEMQMAPNKFLKIVDDRIDESITVKASENKGKRMYGFIGITLLLVLVVVMAIIFGMIWRHRYKKKPHNIVSANVLINPEVETSDVLDCNDKSFLIAD